MAPIDVRTLEQRYIDFCKGHGVSPNTAILSALFKAEVKRSSYEICSLEIFLDQLKDSDFRPLLNLCKELDKSEIQAVDIRNESSCVFNGEYTLSLLHAINGKLREVDLQDLSLGKDFLRNLSQRGLTCQILKLRSSHFRKLNMMGEYKRLQTLNLDFSTSLSSFREDCFKSMPNLKSLSMCQTRITNLWTTIAALSKLPSLVKVRFQHWLCCNDNAPCSSDNKMDSIHPGSIVSNVGDSFSVDIIDLEDPNSNIFSSPNNVSINLDLQGVIEDSSDDSELDFLSPQQEYDYSEYLSNMITQQDEVSSDTSSNSSEERSCKRYGLDVPLKHISSHASPICFEKHYREYMIASLPSLKVLDDLPIRKFDKECATNIFSQYFEHLPYRRKHKESLVNILMNREIRASHSHVLTSKGKSTYPSRKSQQFYARSLSAAKVGSSAWPFLHTLSISGGDLGDERSRRFRPRQFEYHPSDPSLMVFGTLDGEVLVVNHENEKIVSYIPSLGLMNSVLGLSWLKKYPSKLIAGSDNGSLKLYDIQNMPPTLKGTYGASAGSVTFDEFDLLTSVHVNSTDELFLASGYSRNVALYDISTRKRLEVFTDMHREHINVVKFSNHSPSIFATSSFDQDIKMWDLRQKPIRPCYTTSSTRGNVMVCFSPDDHYLLSSAVDNEVRQLLAVDGRVHLNFEIPSTGSSQNYTRSYYMNGRDYIISGSCDEHVVRICCAQTGRRLRDISLEGRGSRSTMYVQSLRGDPFRDFNMSILAAYIRPSSRSEIVKVNLLASSAHDKEYPYDRNSCPANRMGG